MTTGWLQGFCRPCDDRLVTSTFTDISDGLVTGSVPEVDRDEAEAKATSLFRNQLLTPQQATTSGVTASSKAPTSSMPSSVNVVQKEPRVGQHIPSLRGGLDEERV